MSDRTADGGPAAGDTGSPAGEPARESSAGVVGIAFGLVLVLVLVLVVAIQGSGPIDARALIESSFEVGPLPFELELTDAALVATGEKLVVLERLGVVEVPRAPGSSAAPDPGSATGDATETDDEEPPYDWTTLAEGESGTPPIQVFLIWYPKLGGSAAIERQFKNLAWKDLSDFQADGGRLMTDKDTLVWAGYDAGYVIERELERGGTFRDWMRVNLSLPDRACVLLARWGRGKPAAKERVRELLQALTPLPAAGDEHVGG